MKGALRAIFSFISKNGSFIVAVASVFVAVASLCVAALSLHYANQAQEEERSYKELSIRPHLQAMPVAKATEYSISMINNGLGPAEIKDVVYYDGWGCLELFNADGSTNFGDLYKIMEAITRRFREHVSSVPWKTKFEPFVYVAVPLPFAVFRPGASHALAGISEQSVNEIHAELHDLGTEVETSFNMKFLGKALSMPLGIKYCSMSGKYCTISQVDEVQPCKFR